MFAGEKKTRFLDIPITKFDEPHGPMFPGLSPSHCLTCVAHAADRFLSVYFFRVYFIYIKPPCLQSPWAGVFL